MNCVFQINLLLLIVITTVFGSDEPTRSRMKNVFFPDENSDEFDYEEMPEPATNPNMKPNNLRFRIDSTNIPCVNTTMGFCEEVENQAYPMKYVESILAKTDAQTYQNYFNKTIPDETLGLRLSSGESIELCETIQRISYPRVAENVERDWHYVINQPNYHQRIRVEICRNKNSKCQFDESFPNGYESICVQRFAKVPLLSIGFDGTVVSYDYEFPSFCQCQLRSKKSAKIGRRHRY